MTAPTPNAALAYKVLDHIDGRPELWNQGLWVGESDCGTVACFAGWAVLLSGCRVNADSVVIDGPPELVNLDVDQAADRLLGLDFRVLDRDPYDGLLRRDELGEIVAEIFGPRPAATS